MKSISLKTAVEIALAVSAASVFVVVAAWHHRKVANRPIIHGVIVRDQSYSSRTGCESTAALLRHSLEEPSLMPASTVTITVTGDTSTALEPQLLLSVNKPFAHKVFERRDAASSQQEQLINDALRQCEHLPRTNVSPIYLA